MDLDSFMAGMMQTWGEAEGKVERRRLSKLDEIVRSRVEGFSAESASADEPPLASASDLMISFDEFELIVRDVRSAGGVETHEEHLELMMDLFDESLRETERMLGEESDVVVAPALVAVAGRYGLLSLLEPAAFVDPLNSGGALIERGDTYPSLV